MLSPHMSAYELEANLSPDGELLRVDIAGELDLTNARELEIRLDEAAPADAQLVLDLNRVSFIDSAALNVLFRIARTRGRDRLTIVVEPDAPVAGTLSVVGLDRATRVCASPDELTAPSDTAP